MTTFYIILIVIGVILLFSFCKAWILSKIEKASEKTDYKGLYKEASSRLKLAVKENITHAQIISSLSEQLHWHKFLIEKLVVEYEIDEEKFYDMVKELNDTLGIKTPSLDEMQKMTEKLLNDLGLDEYLDEYKKQKKQPKSITFTIDSILEKISAKGVESLSEEEKDFLKKQS